MNLAGENHIDISLTVGEQKGIARGFDIEKAFIEGDKRKLDNVLQLTDAFLQEKPITISVNGKAFRIPTLAELDSFYEKFPGSHMENVYIPYIIIYKVVHGLPLLPVENKFHIFCSDLDAIIESIRGETLGIAVESAIELVRVDINQYILANLNMKGSSNTNDYRPLYVRLQSTMAQTDIGAVVYGLEQILNDKEVKWDKHCVKLIIKYIDRYYARGKLSDILTKMEEHTQIIALYENLEEFKKAVIFYRKEIRSYDKAEFAEYISGVYPNFDKAQVIGGILGRIKGERGIRVHLLALLLSNLHCTGGMGWDEQSLTSILDILMISIGERDIDNEDVKAIFNFHRLRQHITQLPEGSEYEVIKIYMETLASPVDDVLTSGDADKVIAA